MHDSVPPLAYGSEPEETSWVVVPLKESGVIDIIKDAAEQDVAENVRR